MCAATSENVVVFSNACDIGAVLACRLRAAAGQRALRDFDTRGLGVQSDAF